MLVPADIFRIFSHEYPAFCVNVQRTRALYLRWQILVGRSRLHWPVTLDSATWEQSRLDFQDRYSAENAAGC